jgi:predicted DNA binding CopG/RHH family protein
MKEIHLNKEELSQEKEIENGEWTPVPNVDDEIKRHQAEARNFATKNKKINIRLSEWDFNKIKIRAAEEGLPYQTLVSSLIHKYVTGKIKTV